MRIGVIADTHIPRRAKTIPDQVLQAFTGVDLILHAGDLVVGDVLSVLETLAPVEAVIGNNDKDISLPVTRELQVGGRRIGLTHGHLGSGRSTAERALSHFPGFDCVVFGHSHMPYCQWHGSTLALNPGSATDRRRSPHCSFAMLYLESGAIRAEICPIALA